MKKNANSWHYLIWVSEILLKLIQNPFKNCEAGGSFLQSMEGFEKQVL